jgi:hypothetical protein
MSHPSRSEMFRRAEGYMLGLMSKYQVILTHRALSPTGADTRPDSLQELGELINRARAEPTSTEAQMIVTIKALFTVCRGLTSAIRYPKDMQWIRMLLFDGNLEALLGNAGLELVGEPGNYTVCQKGSTPKSTSDSIGSKEGHTAPRRDGRPLRGGSARGSSARSGSSTRGSSSRHAKGGGRGSAHRDKPRRRSLDARPSARDRPPRHGSTDDSAIEGIPPLSREESFQLLRQLQAEKDKQAKGRADAMSAAAVDAQSISRQLAQHGMIEPVRELGDPVKRRDVEGKQQAQSAEDYLYNVYMSRASEAPEDEPSDDAGVACP